MPFFLFFVLLNLVFACHLRSMVKGIHISEVLSTIQQSVSEDGEKHPFSITWCTWSRQAKKGGEKIHFDSALPVVGKRNKEVIYYKKKPNTTTPEKTKRNPHHAHNNTLNIMHTLSKQIRKVHVRLILEFNNKKVFW